MAHNVIVTGTSFFEAYLPSDFTIPEPGTEIFIDEMYLNFGGAFNCASVFAAFGHVTALMVPVGNGISDWALERACETLGIDLLKIPARNNPGISIVFSNVQDRSFLSSVDGDALKKMVDFPPCDWIVVTGLHEYFSLKPSLQKAKENHCKIAVVGSWVPEALTMLSHETDQCIDILFVNEQEFTFMSGHESLQEFYKRINADLIVTKGEKGAVAIINGQEYAIEPTPVEKIVETTGAGDAFASGFLSFLLKDNDINQALQGASKSASAILQQQGGSIWSKQILQQAMECCDE